MVTMEYYRALKMNVYSWLNLKYKMLWEKQVLDIHMTSFI
jgi:hypothetical protein